MKMNFVWLQIMRYYARKIASFTFYLPFFYIQKNGLVIIAIFVSTKMLIVTHKKIVSLKDAMECL